jgi:hypothetical protein
MLDVKEHRQPDVAFIIRKPNKLKKIEGIIFTNKRTVDGAADISKFTCEKSWTRLLYDTVYGVQIKGEEMKMLEIFLSDRKTG